MIKLIQHVRCRTAILMAGFLAAACTGNASSTANFEGNPIWENHKLKLSHKIPSEQGWLERQKGEIVIVNGSSLFTFKGSYATPTISLGDRTVFSVAESTTEKLYYTSIGNLDCLDTNNQNINLTPCFNCPLPQTASNIYLAPNEADGLYLQTDHELYFLKGNVKGNVGQKVYTTDGVIKTAFFNSDTFYIIDTSAGLLSIHPDKEQVAQVAFSTDMIFDIVAAQPISPTETVLATSKSELFIFNGSVFDPLPIQWDEGISPPCILKISKLKNLLAILTDDNCIRILDTKGHELERISCSNTTNATPDSIITDHQGGVWIHTPNHISRIQTHSQLKEFSHLNNLPSSIDSICVHEGSIYAGSDTGLYSLSSNERNFYQAVPSQSQAVQVANAGNWLIYNTADSIVTLKKDITQTIPVGEKIHSIYPSTHNKNTFYSLGEGSIAAYTFKNGSWEQTFHTKIPNGYYSYALEDNNNNIWIGPSFSTAIRIHKNEDGSTEVSSPTLESFKETQIYPVFLRNRLYFLSRKGSAEWNNDTQRLNMEPAYTELLPFSAEEIFKIFPDNLNRWWIQTDKEIGYLSDNGTYIQWYKAPLSTLIPINIKSVYSETQNDVYLATDDRIIYCDLNKELLSKENGLYFRSISLVSKDSSEVIYTGAQADIKPIQLNGRDIRFDFILDNKIRSDQNRYRFKMEGVSDQWSAWIESGRVAFYKLYPGNYILYVEAKDYDGNVSSIRSPIIEIRPPWYLTKWAYGFYTLAGIAFLFFIMNLRIRYVARKTNDLRMIIEQKTSEISKRNDKLALTIEQLNLINKQLKLTNSEKDELLAIVSHDLKNPLSAIINLSQILQTDLDELKREEILEHVSEIEDSAEMMYQIIRNLLDLNRLDQGHIDVKLSPCQLHDIAKEVIEHNANKAKRKQIMLHLNPPEEDAICLGENILLKQVLENLVSNAIKYSPYNSNVYVSVYERRNKIICDVKDEGPGIKPEERHMLFERFTKLSAQPTAGEHSTGLGLAIVKRLTEAMKGRVSCISLPNDGSTFRVSFLKANALNLAKAHKHR